MVPPFGAVAIAPDGQILVSVQSVVNNELLLARLEPAIRLPVTLIVVEKFGRLRIEEAKRPDRNAKSGPALRGSKSKAAKKKPSKLDQQETGQ